jgi:hypothetical protein
MDMDIDVDMNNGFVKLTNTFNFNRQHKYLIKVEPYSPFLYQQQSESIMDYYFSNPEDQSEINNDLHKLDIIQESPEFEANIVEIYYSDKHKIYRDGAPYSLEYVKFQNVRPIKNISQEEFEAPISQVWIKDITVEEEQLVTAVEEGVTIDSEQYFGNPNMLDEDEDEVVDIIREVDGDTVEINGKLYSYSDEPQYIEALKKEIKEKQKAKALRGRSSNIINKLPTRSNIINKLPNLKPSILSLSAPSKQIVLKPSELQRRLTQRQKEKETFTFNIGKGGKKISRKIYNKGKKVSRRKKVTKRVKRVSKRKTNKK